MNSYTYTTYIHLEKTLEADGNERLLQAIVSHHRLFFKILLQPFAEQNYFLIFCLK